MTLVRFTLSFLKGVFPEFFFISLFGSSQVVNVVNVFFVSSQNATNLERFQLSISKMEMYPESNRVVDNLVQDLIEFPIQHVGEYKY